MEQVINALVSGVLTPVVNVVAVAVEYGLAFLAFAVLWVEFAVALVWSQGSLDAAWQWVRALPLLVQGVVWVLFLPVVFGLWVWETTWPLIVRLVLIVGVAGWNLLVFFPRVLTGRP